MTRQVPSRRWATYVLTPSRTDGRPQSSWARSLCISNNCWNRPTLKIPLAIRRMKCTGHKEMQRTRKRPLLQQPNMPPCTSSKARLPTLTGLSPPPSRPREPLPPPPQHQHQQQQQPPQRLALRHAFINLDDLEKKGEKTNDACTCANKKETIVLAMQMFCAVKVVLAPRIHWHIFSHSQYTP